MLIKNLIVILVLAVIIGLAIAYIIKAKKSGAKCIGCPSGGCNCSSEASCSGCGCQTETKE